MFGVWTCRSGWMSKPIKSLPRSKLLRTKTTFVCAKNWWIWDIEYFGAFQNMLFRNFTYSHLYLERNWLKQKNLFTQNVLLLCYTKAICMSFNTHTHTHRYIRPIQFAIHLVRLGNWIQLMDFGKSTYKHAHMLCACACVIGTLLKVTRSATQKFP